MFNLNLDLKDCYHMASPFPHLVIDDFLDFNFAKEIEKSFFDYESDSWHSYSNAIEEKKTCNNWNLFSDSIYKYFNTINSNEFVRKLSDLAGIELYPDCGLHGGGLHIHGSGGNLNPHFDYSIHPKVKLQRKLNIIYYCSSDEDFDTSLYGQLGLWSGDCKQPYELESIVEPKFNRAVIFDTTKNSWHGLVNPLPDVCNFHRKSLAVYFLCEPDANADPRTRALFAPRDWQRNDKNVLDLIEKRSSESSFHKVYVTKP